MPRRSNKVPRITVGERIEFAGETITGSFWIDTDRSIVVETGGDILWFSGGRADGIPPPAFPRINRAGREALRAGSVDFRPPLAALVNMRNRENAMMSKVNIRQFACTQIPNEKGASSAVGSGLVRADCA